MLGARLNYDPKFAGSSSARTNALSTNRHPVALHAWHGSASASNMSAVNESYAPTVSCRETPMAKFTYNEIVLLFFWLFVIACLMPAKGLSECASCARSCRYINTLLRERKKGFAKTTSRAHVYDFAAILWSKNWPDARAHVEYHTCA